MVEFNFEVIVYNVVIKVLNVNISLSKEVKILYFVNVSILQSSMLKIYNFIFLLSFMINSRLSREECYVSDRI